MELVFQGHLFDQFFFSGIRRNFAKIKKNNNNKQTNKQKQRSAQTLLFSCLKFVSRRIWYTVKMLEDFTEGNSRKSQITVKKHLGIYNSRLKTKILTER